MRQTSLLRTIPKAFYSMDLYREVGRQWVGMGFGYLLFVISIFSLPLVIAAIIYTNMITLDKPFDANYLINQVPEITITKGDLSVKVPEPYYIQDKEGSKLAVIDTTHPVTDWEKQMDEHKFLALVVGKNQYFANEANKHKKTIYDIPKDLTTIITSDKVRMWANTALNYSWAAILFFSPFWILGFFLFRIVAAFLYGICGKIISLILRVELSYWDCVRLASVVSTVVLFLSFLAIPLHINLSGWTYFAINLLYLFFAVKANKA